MGGDQPSVLCPGMWSLHRGQRGAPRGHGTLRSLHHHTEGGLEGDGLEGGWLGAQGPFGDS